MGKPDAPAASPPPPESPPPPNCSWIRLRCVAALLFGVAVVLSAVFCLPPFTHGGREGSESYNVDIVASFRLRKTVDEINQNIARLRYDIYDEIGVPNSLVSVMSLEPLSGVNATNVVFGIWPYPKGSTISSAGLSILRSAFVSLVGRQSNLHLTGSLFGNSSFFQVVKFPGGITIIPPQNAFLLQKVQVLFNFTLNFAIDQVQDEVGELKEQMKLGFLLSSYENLYVSLTNQNGSTIAPPTIVQTFIVLAVGNRPPSAPRLKQLAKTIANSTEGNLGLNHTIFGKVKQVQLSSYLQHSLNTGGSSGPTVSPTPAPEPQQEHHHHRRHHHRRRQNPNMYIAPAPAPHHSSQGPSASGCRTAVRTKAKSVVPSAAPAPSPHHPSASRLIGDSPAPAPSPHHPYASRHIEDSPAPAPNMHPPSPLPAVVFAHVHPPSVGVQVEPPDVAPSISPSESSSSLACGRAVYGILMPLLFVLMHL